MFQRRCAGDNLDSALEATDLDHQLYPAPTAGEILGMAMVLAVEVNSQNLA
jgi:hypothetical protein